jgi:Uma2 family endonuclease
MWTRPAPGARHEQICARLHTQVSASVAGAASARLLPARAAVQLRAGTIVRPDLSLVTAATGKLWLAAEIISTADHRSDTVTKKAIYEELNVPRLWMIDPRYDNVEVYHGGPYGLALKGILAGRDILTEELFPALQIVVMELFVA